MNSTKVYNYKLLKVTHVPNSNGVLLVQLDRPKKLNAFNKELIEEYRDCFFKIKTDSQVRCVVLGSTSHHFTAGIDISTLTEQRQGDDIARTSLINRELILAIQDSINQTELCNKPVIIAIHGLCIGYGVDLITAGDIRWCTKEASFCVKEVEMGLAPDIGTLQRLPRVANNLSWVNEVVLSCRKISAEEALKFGLVSKIFDDYGSLLDNALKLAGNIAAKSPVASSGAKHLLLYSRDHSVPEGLVYTAAWNASMIQTEDLPKSVMASMSKKPVLFSNL